MNKRQCLGTISLMIGRSYEATGRLIGNRNLAHSGVVLQMRSKSLLAMPKKLSKRA